jgi:hypothetical protein
MKAYLVRRIAGLIPVMLVVAVATFILVHLAPGVPAAERLGPDATPEDVLKPQRDGGDYLVVSFWSSGDAFTAWSRSPEFLEGHRRGFADVKAARERGEAPPMTSRMETYGVLCE